MLCSATLKERRGIGRWPIKRLVAAENQETNLCASCRWLLTYGPDFMCAGGKIETVLLIE